MFLVHTCQNKTNKTLRGKSEAELLIYKTDSQWPGRLGCSCRLPAHPFPALSGLTRFRQRRKELSCSLSPLKPHRSWHYPSKRVTQLLTQRCFLKLTHLPLKAVAANHWCATAGGGGSHRGQWEGKGTAARQRGRHRSPSILLVKSLRHSEPAPYKENSDSNISLQ